MKDLSFRARISLLSSLLVFLSFSLFFLIENFFWMYIFEDKLDSNFYLGRIFIALSFSLLSGLLVYLFCYNFYESLRKFSHTIQVWSRTLEVPTEKEIFLKYDPEVQNLEKYFLNAIESAKKREEEAILRNLEKNNSNIVEYLKPFLPETKLMGVDYLDISFFPIQTSDYDFDFISIIETEKGCICFLAGFENNEILESIYKYKLFGIITSLKTLYHSKEEEILNFLEKIIEENYFKKLRLSISYIPSTSHHISSIHFQKIPIIHLNDSGITYIQSNEIYLPEKVKFHRAVLDSNSYIIIISDKIHERLELTIADFNSLLEKNIFERPSFRNSKELILEISQLLERLAEKKSIQNILLDFYCIVVKKNQSQEESESF